MGLYSASQLIGHYALHQQPSKTILSISIGGGMYKLQVTCETKVFPKHPHFTKINWPNDVSAIQSNH